MSNIINLYLFLIFLNHLITAVVLFHWCSCNLFRNALLMFSRTTLPILPISSFAWLMSLNVAFFSKFGLWSFNVIRHSSLPLTWILSRIFLIGYFFTLLVDGFRVIGICFFVRVQVRSFFLVRNFSRICTEYGDLQSKSLYSLRMCRNVAQTSRESEHFSHSWPQNIASLF